MSEQTSKAQGTRYQGIRGASSAARLNKFAGQGLQRPSLVLPPKKDEEAGTSPAPNQDRFAAPREQEGALLVPSLTEKEQTASPSEESLGQGGSAVPVANIFAAAERMEKCPLPATPAQSAPPAQPPLSLEQARAQAYAQHLPTRRPLNAPSAPGQGTPQKKDIAAESSNVRGFLSFLPRAKTNRPRIDPWQALWATL